MCWRVLCVVGEVEAILCIHVVVLMRVLNVHWDLNLEFQMLVALRVITKSE